MKKSSNKKSDKITLDEIAKRIERIDKKIEEQNTDKFINLANFNMSNLRTFLTVLSIFIAIAFFVIGFFNVKNIFDLQNAREQINNLTQSAKNIEKRLEEADLRQIFVLYHLDEGIICCTGTDYEPIYYGFSKQRNFEFLYFTGEFRSSIAGDTAYFRFFVTDRIDTLISEEIKTTSVKFIPIKCSLDISDLKDGACDFAFAAKTQEKNKSELKNAYVFVYAKLPAEIKK